MLLNFINNEIIFVIVMTLALTCIAVEIFIPSFGLVGIVGGYLLFESIIAMKNIPNSFFYMMISVFLSFIISFLLIREIMKSKEFDNLVLKDKVNKKSGKNAKTDLSFLKGKEAVVKKILRPSGVVLIDGVEYNVLSYGEFIEVGSMVRVDKVEGSQIYCKRI